MSTISFGDLPGADLIVDCVYAAGDQRNVAADPLHRLLPVGNQGGFRYAGARPSPRVVVLYTTGAITEWPDEVDQTSGILTYYGDNRHAGRALHDTPRGGNQILAHVFERMRGGPEDRAGLPVFLLFESERSTRNVTFRGLVVPGTEVLEADEELIAIWRSEAGHRFQNYRAKFTVLDVPVVSREWINDILDGNAGSPRAPRPWLEWVKARSYLPLEAPTITPARTKDDQLPESSDKSGWELLQGLYDLYRPDPFAFESTAVKLARLALPGPIRMDITRPSVDGGRDAVGGLALGVTKILCG